MPNNINTLGLYTWVVSTPSLIPKLSEFKLFLSGFSSIYSISDTVVSCRIVQSSTIPLR